MSETPREIFIALLDKLEEGLESEWCFAGLDMDTWLNRTRAEWLARFDAAMESAFARGATEHQLTAEKRAELERRFGTSEKP